MSGQLVEQWPLMRLGDVCSFDKHTGNHAGLPYVGMEDIESNTGQFIGDLSPREMKSSTFKFTPKHVLYGRLRPYLNKVIVPNFNGHCSSEIFPILPNELVLQKYLQYWLLMDSTVSMIDATSTGTRMPRANMKLVLEFEIPIPPLEEQQRIVSILDEAFENISNSSKRVEQKLIDAKELFSSLVEEKYTDKEGKWNQKTISELCKIGDGNHSSKYPKKSEMVETGIPFIRGTNLVNGRISDDDIRYITEKKHSTLKKGHLLTGDVLFTNRGEIGKVAIVDERFDNANLNSQLAWFRCGEEITPEFLFYFLQKGEMKRHFSQSKTGAALQQFTIKMIKSVSISYPSLEEQKEIVESCQLMQKRVEEITQIYLKESDSIVELKQSILQEAFNGTLRIAEGLADQS